MNTTEYPPRHIPGFRPLVPGEAWHRTDWTPDMLPEGCRPLLLGERTTTGDCEFIRSEILEVGIMNNSFQATHASHHRRTRRPLPPPPPTFEHDGKTWNSHVPGDPCPVIEGLKIEVLICYTETYSQSHLITTGDKWNWTSDPINQIIGYRIPDEPQDDHHKCRNVCQRSLEVSASPHPRVCPEGECQLACEDEQQDDTAKLRERIAELEDWKAQAMRVGSEWDVQKLAKMLGGNLGESCRKTIQRRVPELLECITELEQQLATALIPRPIAEAGPVKDGFVRLYGADCRLRWVFDTTKEDTDTHFLDIRLPSPNPRAEYERAVAEAGGAFEAWLKAKGGVK